MLIYLSNLSIRLTPRGKLLISAAAQISSQSTRLNLYTLLSSQLGQKQGAKKNAPHVCRRGLPVYLTGSSIQIHPTLSITILLVYIRSTYPRIGNYKDECIPTYLDWTWGGSQPIRLPSSTSILSQEHATPESRSPLGSHPPPPLSPP